MILCEININPTDNDMLIIENWLKLENEGEAEDEGFYCNLNLIKESYNEHCMITFIVDNIIVGFLTYTFYDVVVQLLIMEIKPELRSKGYGAVFVKKFNEYFKSINRIVIRGKASNDGAAKFWDKLNHSLMDRINSSTVNCHYKELIKILNPCSCSSDTKSKILVWQVKNYLIEDNDPVFCWDIDNVNLNDFPILHVVDRNWNIKWIQNNVVMFNDEIRHFKRKFHSIMVDDFLYINHLNY